MALTNNQMTALKIGDTTYDINLSSATDLSVRSLIVSTPSGTVPASTVSIFAYENGMTLGLNTLYFRPVSSTNSAGPYMTLSTTGSGITYTSSVSFYTDYLTLSTRSLFSINTGGGHINSSGAFTISSANNDIDLNAENIQLFPRTISGSTVTKKGYIYFSDSFSGGPYLHVDNTFTPKLTFASSHVTVSSAYFTVTCCNSGLARISLEADTINLTSGGFDFTNSNFTTFTTSGRNFKILTDNNLQLHGNSITLFPRSSTSVREGYIYFSDVAPLGPQLYVTSSSYIGHNLLSFSSEKITLRGDTSFTTTGTGSSLVVPDTSTWTSDRTIATLDDIPATDNFVTLTTSQTISGVKTFNSSVYFNQDSPAFIYFTSTVVPHWVYTGEQIIIDSNDGQDPDILTFPKKTGTIATTSDIPDTSNFVTLTTSQTITGAKTFDSTITLEDTTTYKSVSMYYSGASLYICNDYGDVNLQDTGIVLEDSTMSMSSKITQTGSALYITNNYAGVVIGGMGEGITIGSSTSTWNFNINGTTSSNGPLFTISSGTGKAAWSDTISTSKALTLSTSSSITITASSMSVTSSSLTISAPSSFSIYGGYMTTIAPQLSATTTATSGYILYSRLGLGGPYMYVGTSSTQSVGVYTSYINTHASSMSFGATSTFCVTASTFCVTASMAYITTSAGSVNISSRQSSANIEGTSIKLFPRTLYTNSTTVSSRSGYIFFTDTGPMGPYMYVTYCSTTFLGSLSIIGNNGILLSSSASTASITLSTFGDIKMSCTNSTKSINLITPKTYFTNSSSDWHNDVQPYISATCSYDDNKSKYYVDFTLCKPSRSGYGNDGTFYITSETDLSVWGQDLNLYGNNTTTVRGYYTLNLSSNGSINILGGSSHSITLSAYQGIEVKGWLFESSGTSFDIASDGMRWYKTSNAYYSYYYPETSGTFVVKDSGHDKLYRHAIQITSSYWGTSTTASGSGLRIIQFEVLSTNSTSVTTTASVRSLLATYGATTIPTAVAARATTSISEDGQCMFRYSTNVLCNAYKSGTSTSTWTSYYLVSTAGVSIADTVTKVY